MSLQVETIEAGADSKLSDVEGQEAPPDDLLATVNEACKWINGLIIVVGLASNSLILVVLSKRKVGAPSTSIVMAFLAAADLSVMVIEFLVHYVSYYWRWFVVFHSGLGCGIAYMFQAAAITTSAWYLTAMTIERAVVVCFPMHARSVCTQKMVVCACAAVPAALLAAYGYLAGQFVVVEHQDYTYCITARDVGADFTVATTVVWNTLYFFAPATLIVVLNICIVHRLRLAAAMQRDGVRAPADDGGPRAGGGGKWATASVRNGNAVRTRNLRKASTLVVLASVTFVVLMIPRGVSVCLSLRSDYKYASGSHAVLDSVTYNLQYLNHTANFFVYFIANATFRRVLKRCLLQAASKMPRWRRGVGGTSLITVSTAISGSGSLR